MTTATANENTEKMRAYVTTLLYRSISWKALILSRFKRSISTTAAAASDKT